MACLLLRAAPGLADDAIKSAVERLRAPARDRDIAILMSMGARKEQIRNIFMLQGVLIGITGSAIGLAVGHAINYFADRYHWIRLSEEVYTIGFVPFEPRWVDSLWIAAAAILVSFIATLYPARQATRVAPVESLRYE